MKREDTSFRIITYKGGVELRGAFAHCDQDRLRDALKEARFVDLRRVDFAGTTSLAWFLQVIIDQAKASEKFRVYAFQTARRVLNAQDSRQAVIYSKGNP